LRIIKDAQGLKKIPGSQKGFRERLSIAVSDQYLRIAAMFPASCKISISVITFTSAFF
jgi:hypothetical protein